MTYRLIFSSAYTGAPVGRDMLLLLLAFSWSLLFGLGLSGTAF